jgi:hypothetical protein
LRGTIRDVADRLGVPDPHQVAAAVLAEMFDVDLRAALALCLPDYARHIMARPAWRPMPPPIAPYVGPSGAAYVSSYDRTAREARWARELRRVVHVGETRAWKFLGDCDHADLLSLVAHRTREAEANTAAAARFQRLADLLDATGRETVRALTLDEAAQLDEAAT